MALASYLVRNMRFNSIRLLSTSLNEKPVSSTVQPTIFNDKMSKYIVDIENQLKLDDKTNLLDDSKPYLEQLRFDMETVSKYGVPPREGNGIPIANASMYCTFKAYDVDLLQSFTHRLAMKGVSIGVDTFSIMPLPTKIKRWTVNSSPFVDKEARTQFEMKVHKRLVVIKNSRQEKALNPNQFDHFVDMAKVHRLIDVFLRFVPGIQVTFHHKVNRTV